MFRRPLVNLVVLVATLGITRLGFAQDSFYRGKVLRIIVGFPPGGGYDTYTRLLARHWGKHIPGNPTIVVDNMSGAGSMISANHIFRVAKPDGLTVGHFIGGLFLQQLLGKPGIDFDARRFEYIGAPAQDVFLIGVSKASGITSVQQWIASKTVVKFGGAGFGAGTDDIPALVREVMGLPLQIVAGYKGTADIRLTFNNGEIHGSANSWQSIRSTWRNELESGQLNIILHVALKSHPDLTKYPLAGDMVRNEEGRKLIQAVTQVHGASVRPYVLPPNTPKDRVQLLRKAFSDAMKDENLLAEAQKGNIDINPVNGEEVAKSVQGVLQLESGLVGRLKDILK
ncbi:MAG: Bug family tripartite tricarboxylate transporter substrate binding protein [Candidatus Binatia bacterium]